MQTVSAAVARGHYAFGVLEGRAIGFMCWALADLPDARRWAAGQQHPAAGTLDRGDTVVLLMAVGDDAGVEAVRGAFNHLARLYPGRRWVMSRWGRTRPREGVLPSLGRNGER